ncbi:MAG: N-acetylmuramic acid 6-phosphate etherase, partial [Candidatus Cybelea sp.]
LETPALVALLVAEHRHAVDAVLAQAVAIARAVDAIVARLSRGGSLHYVGAGSSGRIATLDAAEMPPTFGTPPELVQAHIAGGIAAFERAVEGAEDDGAAGDRAMDESVGDGDAVVGISASGGAAFVVAAIERARRSGSYTLGVTNVEDSPLARVAEHTIVLATGPEALAGSTRLKAATAQKIALNAISTAVMVRLGKVHDNLMIDLIASNAKLRRRALRLVTLLADIGEERAREMLDAAEGNVRVAVVMARRNLGAAQARALLNRHAGSLRAVL